MEIITHTLKRIRNWILSHPAYFFIVFGVLAFFVILSLDIKRGFDWDGILVESHGMLFDILLFGILLSLYEMLSDKRNMIRTYQEEIDDFRRWEADEAKFRILGNIKRLNRLGVSNIRLRGSYLLNADFYKMNLEGADLSSADLRGASFGKAILSSAIFEDTKVFLSQKKHLLEAGIDEIQLKKIDWYPDPPKHLRANYSQFIQWDNETNPSNNCVALTKSSKLSQRCKNKALPGKEYCRIHI